ncbi:hypothetical protein WN943_027077 [Citrus x changshan-huyou]
MKTNEESLASILDRVIEEQWRTHVAYWDNEEVKVRRAGENCLKPAKQPKKRSEVEPGVARDHTSTLKSELGYLRLESLQTLGNESFEEYSYFHAYGGLGVSKIFVESKFEAYSLARCSGVVSRTSAIPL